MTAIPVIPGRAYTVKYGGQRILVMAESGARAIAKFIFAIRGR